MAKRTEDVVLDAPLDFIAANVTRVIACSAEPTTYTEAITTYALADVTVDSSDFSKANGDTSGRKTTMAAQSGVLIDTSGTANHVARVDVTNTRLIDVTTCTSQALTANGSNTVNIPAYDSEFNDPT